MEQRPMVSVVMPARDAAGTIDASIESVLAQTIADWELIVVDDGSVDGTAATVSGYCARDPRVRLLAGPSRGEPAARNVALAEARGRLIAMLDADDLASRGRLEAQARFLDTNPDLVAAASHAVLFVRDGEPLGLSAVTGPATRPELERMTDRGELLVLCHPTLMWRADALRELDGYDERFVQGCDAELVNRAVYACGWRLLVIQEPLVWYRISAHGMSSRGLALQRRFLRYLERRNAAWVTGGPVPDLDGFLDGAGDLRTRWRWWRHDVGASLYRQGAIHVGERAWPRAVLPLAAAATMHPRYVLAKAWRQRISSGARRARSQPAPVGRRAAP